MWGQKTLQLHRSQPMDSFVGHNQRLKWSPETYWKSRDFKVHQGGLDCTLVTDPNEHLGCHILDLLEFLDPFKGSSRYRTLPQSSHDEMKAWSPGPDCASAGPRAYYDVISPERACKHLLWGSRKRRPCSICYKVNPPPVEHCGRTQWLFKGPQMMLQSELCKNTPGYSCLSDIQNQC